jgi:hypothetical protein
MDLFKDVGTWLDKPEAPVLMGNLASAIMGPYQDSWQAKTGNVASQFGQSAMASDALKKQQTEQTQFRKMLLQALTGMPGSGVGLTDPTLPGDTDVTWKINPDGTYKKTVSGMNQPTGGEGERMAQTQPMTQKPMAGGTQAVGGQMSQPARPSPTGVPQGQRFNPSLVPLF